jgi:hypothetical protein
MKTFFYCAVSTGLLFFSSCSDSDGSAMTPTTQPNATTANESSTKLNSSLTAKVLPIDGVDTDGDGLSDYAEERIAQLDKNNPNDIKLLKGSDIITIKTIGLKVSLYQTSYFQDNNPGLFSNVSFNTSELSASEIDYLKNVYLPNIRKMYRRPASLQSLENYVNSNGDTFNKVLNAKPVTFRSDPSLQNIGARYDPATATIHVQHGVLNDLKLTGEHRSVIPLQLFIHAGINLTAASGLSNMVENGYNSGRTYEKNYGTFSYKVLNLEDKFTYVYGWE